MIHYVCRKCIIDGGYPEWYMSYARNIPQICCVCDAVTADWLECHAADGKLDEELVCAAVHLEDVW